MKQRILTFFLAAVLAVGAASVLSACGPTDGLNYLSIKEGGETVAYEVQYLHSAKEDASITEVEIAAEVNGKPVVRICSEGFRDAKYLTKIVIPDSVTEIGKGAFLNCTALVMVNIPQGVEDINESTFYNCPSLKTISIPATVKTIGYDAFWGCTSLTAISFPASLTWIGAGAFEGCSALTSVKFANTGWTYKDEDKETQYVPADAAEFLREGKYSCSCSQE